MAASFWDIIERRRGCGHYLWVHYGVGSMARRRWRGHGHTDDGVRFEHERKIGEGADQWAQDVSEKGSEAKVSARQTKRGGGVGRAHARLSAGPLRLGLRD